MKKLVILLFIAQLINLSCTNRDNFGGYISPDHRKNENKRDAQLNYLALGDSYTIGESVVESKRFPVQLAEKLYNIGIVIASPTIVAQTGWTTDELKAGMESARLNPPYELVTLLIGVNNQYRGYDTTSYRSEFIELLKQAIRLAGNNPKKVIVLSIPDYGVTPFAQGLNRERIRTEIDAYNRINGNASEFEDVHYINITGISRAAENNLQLIASDGLHPSAEMYRLWVEALFPVAKQILEDD